MFKKVSYLCNVSCNFLKLSVKSGLSVPYCSKLSSSFPESSLSSDVSLSSSSLLSSSPSLPSES